MVTEKSKTMDIGYNSIGNTDSVGVKHATWDEWPHVGKCYRVRFRGSPSSFSSNGFNWTDSYGKQMARPALNVMFHGGPLNGQTIMETSLS